MSIGRKLIWPAVAAYGIPAAILYLWGVGNDIFNYDEYRPQSDIGLSELATGLLIIVPPVLIGYSGSIIPADRFLKKREYSVILHEFLLITAGTIGGIILEVTIMDLMLGRFVLPSEAALLDEIGFLALGAGCGLYATLVWIAFNHRHLRRARTKNG